SCLVVHSKSYKYCDKHCYYCRELIECHLNALGLENDSCSEVDNNEHCEWHEGQSTASSLFFHD
ncbi:MAG: hypothetical protein IJY32_09480, partial [Mogibacterium sp.]|nr:hypothetical protein [Mogibacterium sp.]